MLYVAHVATASTILRFTAASSSPRSLNARRSALNSSSCTCTSTVMLSASSTAKAWMGES